MSRDKSSARSVVAVLLVLAMSLLCAASARAQSPAANAQVIEIKLADLNDDNPLINYRKAVLELAMRASGRPFSIKGCQVANVATSDQRYVQLVQAGQYCNLIATSAGSGMTRTLEAIPFPIYLGGGGYRVLLANRESLERARTIRTLDDLRTFTIGSGIGWVDTSIMQANQLKVAQSNYLNLFDMLKAGRFDFYNRSIFEATSELETYDPAHQLAIVPDLVLYYPTDLFFYTSPGRDDIRDALLDGLKKIHRNAALLDLIQKHGSTRQVRQAMRGTRPRVIELQNDRLTPIERQAIETYKMDWFK
ncbi:ABC transporter substrate-binding protein [Herbaspirillum sp. RU 5E]|nr:ABC transporter substrate-binding protein [Herbaspirillum sp. RU 5E]